MFSHLYLQLNPFRIILFSIVILAAASCGRKASHAEHSNQESEGLIQVLSPSLSDTLEFHFRHPFRSKGDTLFTAPAAIITLGDAKSPETTYIARFAINESNCRFSDKIQERISEGIWPTGVTLMATSQNTYVSIVETMSEKGVKVGANLSMTYSYETEPVISMEQVEGTILITEAGEELSENLTDEEVPLHSRLSWDCHSHWSFCNTTCHCKTGTCCPGETCGCDTTGNTNCGGHQFCFCD